MALSSMEQKEKETSKSTEIKRQKSQKASLIRSPLRRNPKEKEV